MPEVVRSEKPRKKPAWKLSVLHAFKGGEKDGANPQAPLIFNNGNIYGTTYDGGSTADTCTGNPNFDGCGTVFEITP